MTTRIRVAVCTNRSPEAVAEALAAVAADAPDAPRALVTSGLSQAAVDAHGTAAPGWTILAEPEPGLSRARNRALAWAADDDDVLAFVDDDAVVEPGWHGALLRRWDEAPATVACIGGPIRPRFETPPPPWVSDQILPALTLLDRGAEVRDLDPANEEAVYGANISFRAGPLRDVGGFATEWGHSGSRIYFGEEDEAQRALKKAGFSTRYIPDAAVLHVIPPERLTRKSFVKRRYAFGKALGARGGRRRGLAAKQVATATAGVVLAAVQRNDSKLMERAVRAAENLGALTARRARA
ncbi:MAG: glucosyl-dolichyl phosphate glucuronosyltransferase [Thermoleophilales bacterium]|nr:glucosyl-dolichyl phosphate glucuronosyltransferase [Thermoleophilales bacterium]